jgi:sulfite exporter TauE/SafE
MEALHALSSAAVLGLLGGFHCLGMCGPLALAIPGTHFIRALIYHSGRLMTYAILGLFSGMLGDLLRIAGFQQWVSIMSGALILALVWIPSKHLSVFSDPFYRFLGRVSQSNNPWMMWVSGLANGLLPCGLVYVAMAGALSAPDAFMSMGYMVVFGLGTLPLLLALSFAGKILPVSSRVVFRRLIPYAASLVACLLIVRGMNLGIPYVSPKIDRGQAECCKPGRIK